MYLNELSKEQANVLLNLVSEFVMSDNKFAKEEKKITKEYYEEINISEDNYSKITYEKCLEILNESSKRIKLIVYMKILRTALVDGDYEIGEVDFLEKLSNDLNIDRAKKIQIANFFYEYNELEDENKEEAKEMLNNILSR